MQSVQKINCQDKLTTEWMRFCSVYGLRVLMIDHIFGPKQIIKNFIYDGICKHIAT